MELLAQVCFRELVKEIFFQKLLAQLYFRELVAQVKPHESILVREASRKYTCSRSLTKVYLVYKPRGSIIGSQAS